MRDWGQSKVEHTGLLFLFTCQPTKSSNFSRSGVNIRAHLLRKNYSRNFSSIRNALRSSVKYKTIKANIRVLKAGTIQACCSVK